MEYCETDLAKLLKKEIFLPEELAIKYFKQIIEGIKYIYEKNAFHRDLKVLLHSFLAWKPSSKKWHYQNLRFRIRQNLHRTRQAMQIPPKSFLNPV